MDLKYAKIKEVISGMLDRNTFLDSVGSIHKTLVSEHQLEVKPKDVHHVLKNELHMSFKKIVPISIRANSVKNLVLRK